MSVGFTLGHRARRVDEIFDAGVSKLDFLNGLHPVEWKFWAGLKGLFTKKILSFKSHILDSNGAWYN